MNVRTVYRCGRLTIESKGAFATNLPEQNIRIDPVVIGPIVHENLPEEIAYLMTKTVLEDTSPQGEHSLEAAFPPLKGLDLAQATIESTLTPLHPGAVRYFKEIGKQLKPEQIPPGLKQEGPQTVACGASRSGAP